MNIFNKYKEVILYLFFGVLTTIINFIVYFILSNILNSTFIANTIAWIASVLVAFITNRLYVFNSHNNLFKEICLFFSARIFSLIVDDFCMIAFVDYLLINKSISKIIVNVIVVIINYLFSKFLIFKKNKTS